jgi:SAM-dependent methyltransferase
MTQHRDHHHHHDHSHQPDDFDWEALADSLELDAAITMPIVDQVLQSPIVADATHILDVGCGPGVVAVRMTRLSPTVRVTALDSSEPLLARVRHRAAEAGVGDRVDTIAADLEHPLPARLTAGVIWASMVLHHVSDPGATLERLRDRLTSDGVLVMIEFGNPPTVLSPDDPLVADGTWSRFQAATAASLNERLGLDPVTIDWPEALRRAGFTAVTDAGLSAEHDRPLNDQVRAWLAMHLRRGIDMAGDRLSRLDIHALNGLADAVAGRDDLFVVAERRVLTARRA